MKIFAVQNLKTQNLVRQNSFNNNIGANKKMDKFQNLNKYDTISFGGSIYFKNDPAIKSIEKIKSRSGKVPKRVEKLAQEYTEDETLKNLPLAVVHKIAYSDLKKCKTLDEAKNLFPEFEEAKAIDEPYAKPSSVLYGIQQGHITIKPDTTDDASLKILQHYWADLVPVAHLPDFAHCTESGYKYWDLAPAFNKLKIPCLNSEYTQAIKSQKDTAIGNF